MISPPPLQGGNTSQPFRQGAKVFKPATQASPTLHHLLEHLRTKGLDWIPRSYGLEEGFHVLSFLPGIVPQHAGPQLLTLELLEEAARKLRAYHDATQDFFFSQEYWNLPSQSPREVICHSDFAPYNCIIEDGQIRGLIDFDQASPGPRIWDLAYAAYRFIPLQPEFDSTEKEPTGPREKLMERLECFLDWYSGGQKSLRYSSEELLETLIHRLEALAQWTLDFARKENKPELEAHGSLYQNHILWIRDF